MFFNDVQRHKQFITYILILLFVSENYSLNVRASRVQEESKNDADAGRSFRIHATDLKCAHVVPDIIESFDCQLAWRNNRSYSSGSLVLRQPVNNLRANAVLDIYQPNGRLTNIFNITVDCCSLLSSGKHGLKLFDNLLKIFFAQVNERPTCPLKAHFNYTVTDFYVNESILPAYIPKTRFRSGLYLSTMGRPAARVVVLGKILKLN
ncbi:uncharacterized protein LOC114804379 [Zeugodacus cucurbitae]|uniref:uncharacterized protein LOC114804379 n=1 Tax=Zeugodacus cucurbitae TaxID=28588 RepID=UPI0023D925F9|nr:uncharacterized protein LOC114804379 [Zeugodacus cucurbitae]